MAIQLVVNGRRRSLEVDPATPLLWVVRDALGLTGTKYGCGQSLCGACTVLVEGSAIRSCTTAVGEVAGKRVTTIEGLSPDGNHPVQRAWVAEQVPQCGYCQSGQILEAVALLARKLDPTDGDIDDALSGVLCRCGTYPRIRRAVKRAAVEVRRGR